MPVRRVSCSTYTRPWSLEAGFVPKQCLTFSHSGAMMPSVSCGSSTSFPCTYVIHEYSGSLDV
eukprot:36931-Eustigmatos_ZCMA.PRE.1